MKLILKFTSCIFLISLLSFQKKKNDSLFSISPASSSYSSDVLDKWMAMQIRLMSSTTASVNGPFVRIYSYSSIAAYAAIYPGISEKSSNFFSMAQLNNIPELPKIDETKKYHWPSSISAALAFMNRAFFTFTSASNKAALDSLENDLYKSFSREADAATIERSAAFGKTVAQKIFDWSETDGYRHASNPYTPPAGPGMWVPTPPTFTKAITPYWGNLRSIVPGSIDNTQPKPPPVYSEDTASDFYKMVKEVYDADQNLSPDQKALVLFWKEINPGVTAPGHWLNIVRQVIQKDKSKLDRSAFAYALTGMALNDAWISCWKTRYKYNVLRPITYIRDVMGHKDWLPMLGTPPHPEYTSGFAAMAGAVAEALTNIFGNNYKLTDHTYDYLGMLPRTYNSFPAMAKEAGDSKFYCGIHYLLSVDIGLDQGKAVAKNIAGILLQNGKSIKP